MFNTFRRLHEGVYRFARRGAPTGPNVTLVGGVHGNERIGVEVLDALRLALLRAAPLTTANNLFPVLKRGSVTLVYGNPSAQRIGKRGSEPHADLNRCFPRDLLEASEGVKDALSYEHRRAEELGPIFASSDLLVDLHSTNKPSPPFVRLSGYDKVPTQLLEISGRLPATMLLLDPKHLIGDGNVALTDEFVGVCGGMGICYESGLASDLSRDKIDSITRGLLQILHHDMEVLEFVDAEGRTGCSGNLPLGVGQNTTARDAYEITQVFKLTSKGFQWADGVGEENFQRVPAGQSIGYVGSEPFAVNYDSHIVFPKVPALWKIDAYVCVGIGVCTCVKYVLLCLTN
jgi:hypothetical protein